MGIERELAQLVARGLAIAAEQRRQCRARLRRDAQTRQPQFVVDQFGQIALAVGIAGNRDRGFGALAGLAQRRFRPELSGLDDDAAILDRRIGQRIDAAGKVARAGADANRAAATEQRDGHGFLDQPRRLGGEFVAGKAHQRKRVVGVVDRGGNQRVGALAHQPGVGTIEQDDRSSRIGPGEIRIDFPAAQRHHQGKPVNGLLTSRRRRRRRAGSGYARRSPRRRDPPRHGRREPGRNAGSCRGCRRKRARTWSRS